MMPALLPFGFGSLDDLSSRRKKEMQNASEKEFELIQRWVVEAEAKLEKVIQPKRLAKRRLLEILNLITALQDHVIPSDQRQRREQLTAIAQLMDEYKAYKASIQNLSLPINVFLAKKKQEIVIENERLQYLIFQHAEHALDMMKQVQEGLKCRSSKYILRALTETQKALRAGLDSFPVEQQIVSRDSFKKASDASAQYAHTDFIVPSEVIACQGVMVSQLEKLEEMLSSSSMIHTAT